MRKISYKVEIQTKGETNTRSITCMKKAKDTYNSDKKETLEKLHKLFATG